MEYTNDSIRHADVPRGTITEHSWQSNLYARTTRKYWLYVPAQYDGQTAAGLMVFQDGGMYVNETGPFRTPIVLDNLIHQGRLPLILGLFIDPGHQGAAPPTYTYQSDNRSYEYDTLSDEYVTFLSEELIPEVAKSYRLVDDPKWRGIAGISSGGICAFTAAWQRPDLFHKVLSHVGSFADIRGGHEYPTLIRKSAKRDIRVFLQAGSNDLDNRFGNWWLGNLQMEAALKFRGYDYQFAGGTGGHNGEHGGMILPESLAWLWCDPLSTSV